jgi:hypothetical protein
LNHDDSRAINTLDTLVEEDGVRFVRHYLIDFGAILGSASYRVDSPRTGFEYLFDFKPAAQRFATLGLWTPEWSRKANFPDIPSVGRLEWEVFNPDTWKPEYPNAAFLSADPVDEFWAAKQVMAFRDEHIRAIVRTGEYSDPRAEDWVVRALIARRDKIGRASFAKVLPLDRFRVENGRLEFSDLGARYFGTERAYRIDWFELENKGGTLIPLDCAGSAEVPQGIQAPFLAARIQSDDPEKTVIVYLRNGTSVVGVDRTW